MKKNWNKEIKENKFKKEEGKTLKIKTMNKLITTNKNKRNIKRKNPIKVFINNPYIKNIKELNLKSIKEESNEDKNNNFQNPPKKIKPIINKNSKKRNDNTNITNSIVQIKKKTKLNETKKIMQYNGEELNNLTYKLALIYDKRSYLQYYISLLSIKHPLLFTFFNDKEYNVKIIKIDLFLFGFALYYVVNALFFNDNTMHKIYEDEGAFNLNYQLPQILYSSIISSVFNIILKLLALSNGAILEYKGLRKKKQNNKGNLDDKEKKLIKNLQIKFLIYFIISTIFLLFFWYYASMFCAIYQNTQIHLIKDTFISYGLSQIYPFAIYLLPGIFRIPALSNAKAKRKCLYNFSKIVQMI